MDDPSATSVIQVAVPRPLHGAYDYRVPSDLALPTVGCRVKVPFGASNTVAIVTNTSVDQPHTDLKSVIEVLDTEPILDHASVALAEWMTRYYHYPLGEVLATLLPAAARKGRAAEVDPPDLWQLAGPAFSNPRAPAQEALCKFLQLKQPATGDHILAAGHTRRTLAVLVKGGYVERCSEIAPSTESKAAALSPNPGQILAINAITEVGRTYRTFLLQGVTGSGKTEVYLQAIAHVLAAGQQALVLVPEIALTPQTVARFESRFDGVAVLHSALNDTERLQTWLRCKNKLVNVLIGTRSAVFTPMPNLGLVIVDEEHDTSYKQQDGLRYSARDVAIKRAQNTGIPVVLGSATPALESLHNCQRGRYQHLHLAQRAGGAQMPSYHIIDMRGQDHTDGIAVPMQHVIRRHLKASGQVLVFLNRRGYSPTLLCTACGWQAQCPACDARLTYHRDPEQLICHHCALRFPVGASCTQCERAALLPVGMGTQRTEAGLTRLFGSNYPIYRIDRDSVRSQQALEAQLAKINSGDTCLMVGTQMLAKGHHFPNVTLVVVLNADGGFLSADFKAPERTAQTIIQVAGRAGRANRPGEVWIQTYQPNNPLLQSLIEDGYDGFAQRELSERAKLGMPPIKPMAMLRADALRADDAIVLLNLAKDQLARFRDAVEIWGPVSAPLARIAGRCRYQIMIIGTNRQYLHAALNQLHLPKRNQKLRWSLDIDPYDSL